MAGPGVPYAFPTSGSSWVGIVEPCLLTPLDFSETFDYVAWNGTDWTPLAFELMPTATGKITIDAWLSTYAGSNETEGNTEPFPDAVLWADWTLVSPDSGSAGWYPGSGSWSGPDDYSYSAAIACTAGTPVKIYGMGGVEDLDGNDIADMKIHYRLRTSAIVDWDAPTPSPSLWSPTVTWPGGARTVVDSTLPSRRHFRPR